MFKMVLFEKMIKGSISVLFSCACSLLQPLIVDSRKAIGNVKRTGGNTEQGSLGKLE